MDTQESDADAEMQEMMGFASFGMQKPGTSSSIHTCSSLFNVLKFGTWARHLYCFRTIFLRPDVRLPSTLPGHNMSYLCS